MMDWNPWATGRVNPVEFGGAQDTPWWASFFGGGDPAVKGPLAASGALWPLMNPIGRAAIAAGGILQPTPAETGELPSYLSGVMPAHPTFASTVVRPAASPGGGGARILNMTMPQRPPSMTYPSWPTPGASSGVAIGHPAPTPPAAAADNASNDLPPPRPAAMNAPMPPPRPAGLGGSSQAGALRRRAPPLVDLGYGPFTQIRAPNADPLRRNAPMMTALNLGNLFGRG